MISLHLDSDDLDAIPFNHERSALIAEQARIAHATLVAGYLGGQLPYLPMLDAADDTVTLATSPINP